MKFVYRSVCSVFISFLLFVAFGCAKVSLISEDHASVTPTPDTNTVITSPTSTPTPTPTAQAQPLPGYAVSTGGGISSGTGLQVHSTIGETSSHNVQIGSGLVVTSGLQGAQIQ